LRDMMWQSQTCPPHGFLPKGRIAFMAGVQLNRQSSGLQDRRLRVRVLSPCHCSLGPNRSTADGGDLSLRHYFAEDGHERRMAAVGLWRSLVTRLFGGQEVAGSNPA